MQYIQIIKRLDALQLALPRAYSYTSKHEESDIDFDIQDKITELKNNLKVWCNGALSTTKERCNRRRQIRTACRLLKIDYNGLML